MDTKKLITATDWDRLLNDAEVRREDIDRLVMNYLVTEGHGEAAKSFQQESGIQMNVEFSTVTLSLAAKQHVVNCEFEDAIRLANLCCGDIQDTNPLLLFHLHQQHFIEFLRDEKLEEALEFAHKVLAPMGEKHEEILNELEKTLAILAFENKANCTVSELLDISYRLKIANETCAAILTSKGHEKDSKLPRILKMLIWVQERLGLEAQFPKLYIMDD